MLNIRKAVNEGDSEVLTDCGKVIEYIIYELAFDSELPIPIITQFVSKYYGVSVDLLRIPLKHIDSLLVSKNNNIAGFIDGREIRRTTIHSSSVKILTRIKRKLAKNIDQEDMDSSIILKVINQYCNKSFFTDESIPRNEEYRGELINECKNEIVEVAV